MLNDLSQKDQELIQEFWDALTAGLSFLPPFNPCWLLLQLFLMEFF